MASTEQIEKRFTLSEKSQVSVSNISGTITIQGEERDDIQVIATKHLDGRGDPERTAILIEQEGDCVIVKTRYPDGNVLGGLFGRQACPVDYDVRVPAESTVTTRQVDGTTQVADITGRVSTNSVSGLARLTGITGRLRVEAVSASIVGKDWQGAAAVKTVSGDVYIATAQFTNLKASTVSGDMTLEMALDEAGDYDIHSVSGDVFIYLPPEQGVNSVGSSISGGLQCSMPRQFSFRGFRSWKAIIRDGGPPLHFHSVSGDLVLSEQQAVAV